MSRPDGAAEPRGRLVEVPGLRMYAVERGGGRPVVFLHGLGWDHTLWTGAMETVSRDYRAIAADTRGHGRSDTPPGPYSVAMFAEDWHHLLARLDVRDACLVGFSLGGMIAMLLALERREQVAALVLACTLCYMDPAISAQLEERIDAAKARGPEAGARVGARQIFSPRFMARDPDRVERFVRWRAAMAQEPLFEASRASRGFDVCARLREISVPCLVMYGDDDAITPPRVVKQIAEHLPGAETVGFPGTGHMIPVENPDGFAAALTSFLAARFAPHRE